ncbi:MAG: hypothetical protein HGB23_10835 [Chlorobiaceae bacterium]|nr:hypothetical protein [Chlorobiaceae bacterium]
MHDLGFIRGVLPVTENAHVCDRWENILRVHNVEKIFVEIDGEMQEVTAPMREADDEEEPRNWVLLPNKRVSVTHEGLEFIVNEIRGANPDFGATLSPSVVTLMNNRLYDTAVREGCVILEHSIKAKLGSNKWGDRLTDEFFEYLKDEKNVLESWLRTYSQELRTIFKIVRNVFMHNLITIDELTAIIHLFRISRAITAINF